MIRIIPKDKLKVAFLKTVNDSTQDELNFCEGKPVQRGKLKKKKKKGNW